MFLASIVFGCLLAIIFIVITFCYENCCCCTMWIFKCCHKPDDNNGDEKCWPRIVRFSYDRMLKTKLSSKLTFLLTTASACFFAVVVMSPDVHRDRSILLGVLGICVPHWIVSFGVFCYIFAKLLQDKFCFEREGDFGVPNMDAEVAFKKDDSDNVIFEVSFKHGDIDPHSNKIKRTLNHHGDPNRIPNSNRKVHLFDKLDSTSADTASVYMTPQQKSHEERFEQLKSSNDGNATPTTPRHGQQHLPVTSGTRISQGTGLLSTHSENDAVIVGSGIGASSTHEYGGGNHQGIDYSSTEAQHSSSLQAAVGSGSEDYNNNTTLSPVGASLTHEHSDGDGSPTRAEPQTYLQTGQESDSQGKEHAGAVAPAMGTALKEEKSKEHAAAVAPAMGTGLTEEKSKEHAGAVAPAMGTGLTEEKSKEHARAVAPAMGSDSIAEEQASPLAVQALDNKNNDNSANQQDTQRDNFAPPSRKRDRSSSSNATTNVIIDQNRVANPEDAMREESLSGVSSGKQQTARGGSKSLDEPN